MKKLAVLTFAVLFSAFSVPGGYTEISDLDIVSGVAIDKTENGWEIVCEVFLPSSDSDFGSSCTVLRGGGDDFASALAELSSRSKNELWFGSVQLYIIGDGAVCAPDLREHLLGGGVNHRAVTLLSSEPCGVFREGAEHALSLAKKARRVSAERGMPLPRVTEYLRGGEMLRLSGDAL